MIEASAPALALCPLPLRAVDFDDDRVFMNEPVVDWCGASGPRRSRAYREQDQAWVEQKNGAIVRRLVGYGHFEGVAAGGTLARLYAAARLVPAAHGAVGNIAEWGNIMSSFSMPPARHPVIILGPTRQAVQAWVTTEI